MKENSIVLKAENLTKYFYTPEKFQVLKNISFEVQKGEFLALVGKSGCGKSTLLYILSTMDTDYEGRLEINDYVVTGKTQNELSKFRNEHIGFVFQFHYLIAELTALENVLFPTRKAGEERHRREDAKELLELFGLGEKMHRLPRELSGGEQQRMAIARSLIMRPKYLFADEPTGSLDSINGERVMSLIREANTKLGTTVILVTHDRDFAATAHRQIQLADGKVVKSIASFS
jgi:lipoprotein-releasing system ATP-binding protein